MLTRLLQYFGIFENKVSLLTSNLSSIQRQHVFEKIQTNSTSIVIASDIAARGIDFQNLKCVIHYDAPSKSKTLIHRNGRTARGKKGGVSYSLVEPQQAKNFLSIWNEAYGKMNISMNKEQISPKLIEKHKERYEKCLQRVLQDDDIEQFVEKQPLEDVTDPTLE